MSAKAGSVLPEAEHATLAPPESFPLLLKNFDRLCVKSASYSPSDRGHCPLDRPIAEYLNYGIINVDKTSGPSSHEVVSWVKKILELDRTGHSGTLDPSVTGCLLVCLNRATRLVKSQQELGKEYVTILQFANPADCKAPDFPARLNHALEELACPQLQRPPAEGCAVKRVLRVREIYFNRLLEFDAEAGRAVIHVSCQAGTYIRTLCVHIGLLLGSAASMLELRRVRTGGLTEKTNMVTLHDVLDAFWLYKHRGDESYLRKVVMPLEFLLTGYKRIFVKDSAVNALTYGAPLLIHGVLRYDPAIAVGDTVVLCSTKGEAIALGEAKMGAADIAGANHGVTAAIKRVIMDRDTYAKQWGLGPVAKERKELIRQGLLDKYGAVTDKTPAEWKNRWQSTDGYLRASGDTCLNSTDRAAADVLEARKAELLETEGDAAVAAVIAATPAQVGGPEDARPTSVSAGGPLATSAAQPEAKAGGKAEVKPDGQTLEAMRAPDQAVATPSEPFGENDKGGKSEKTDKKEGGEKREKDKKDKKEKKEKKEKDKKGHREKTEKTEKRENEEKTEQSETSHKPQKSEKPGKSEKSEKIDKPENSANSANSTQSVELPHSMKPAKRRESTAGEKPTPERR